MPRDPHKSCLLLAPAHRSPALDALVGQLDSGLGLQVRPAATDELPRSIRQSDVVLADLSGRDPHVLYGVGVAHTLGKRVFLVTDSIADLPFDLAGIRASQLSPVAGNQRAVVDAMRQFLEVPFAIGPVRLFLGMTARFGENLVARRLAAAAIDFLVLSALAMAAFALVLVMRRVAPNPPWTGLPRELLDPSTDANRYASQVVLNFGTYVVLVYFAVTTWAARASPGQFLLGLRIVQVDYHDATLGQCLGRALLWLLAASPIAAVLSVLALSSRPVSMQEVGLAMQMLPFSIRDAELVIADVSRRNPNVQYELGIAHALGKRVFVASDAAAGSSEQVGPVAAVRFDGTASGRETLARELARFVTTPGMLSPITWNAGELAVAGQSLTMRRLAAFAVNALCGSSVGIVMIALADAGVIVPGWLAGADFGPVLLLWLGFVLPSAIFTTSPGLQRLGLQLTRLDRSPATWLQRVARPVVAFATLGLGFLWALKAPRHQAVHDIITRTLVLRRGSFEPLPDAARSTMR